MHNIKPWPSRSLVAPYGPKKVGLAGGEYMRFHTSLAEGTRQQESVIANPTGPRRTRSTKKCHPHVTATSRPGSGGGGFIPSAEPSTGTDIASPSKNQRC